MAKCFITLAIKFRQC